MTRNDVRRRLALAWWWQVLVTLAPLVLLNALFAAERASSLLAMPLFIAGVFYYIFNFVVAFVMEKIEKRMNYYR